MGMIGTRRARPQDWDLRTQLARYACATRAQARTGGYWRGVIDTVIDLECLLEGHLHKVELRADLFRLVARSQSRAVGRAGAYWQGVCTVSSDLELALHGWDVDLSVADPWSVLAFAATPQNPSGQLTHVVL